MTPLLALQNLMRRFLERELSLQDLHHELSVRVQEIADDPLEESSLLSEAAWIAISQFADGELDENGLRTAIRSALGLAAPTFGRAEHRTAVNATVLPVQPQFLPRPRYVLPRVQRAVSTASSGAAPAPPGR